MPWGLEAPASGSAEVYLQQRGAHKDLLPLRWDTAVGGHVSYGEYIEEALYREAAEELHFFDFNPVWLTAYQFESESERELVNVFAAVGNESESERELVNVFAAVGNFRLRPDPEELCGGRYWKDAELMEAYGNGILTPSFQSEYTKIRRMLQALL